MAPAPRTEARIRASPVIAPSPAGRSPILRPHASRSPTPGGR